VYFVTGVCNRWILYRDKEVVEVMLYVFDAASQLLLVTPKKNYNNSTQTWWRCYGFYFGYIIFYWKIIINRLYFKWISDFLVSPGSETVKNIRKEENSVKILEEVDLIFTLDILCTAWGEYGRGYPKWKNFFHHDRSPSETGRYRLHLFGHFHWIHMRNAL
jgi:hypothetical protein